MNAYQKKRMVAFERICAVRHIDCACVVCGDDNPEDLVIENISDDSGKRKEKSEYQNYNEILASTDDVIRKKYTILCQSCHLARQYYFTHKDKDKEAKEEYEKMMEKITQGF
jgi:DNA/RNA endonuclease YhcR with UshA esterase domain